MELSNLDFKFLVQDKILCDINVSSLCRICLDKIGPDKKYYNIFDGFSPTYNLIMLCASVQISEGDGLPNIMCTTCYEKLNIAWQFKSQCEHSDSKLREIYINTNLTHIDITENSGLTVEESLCFNIFKPDEIHAVNENGENVHIEVLPNRNFEDIAVQENIFYKKEKDKNSKQNIVKKFQCDQCGKVFQRNEYLIQHIRSHTGDRPFNCLVCEKRFINSGHLSAHMRKHTGDFPHSCTLCARKFSTKQGLKKHIMVHNRDRPYKCDVCEKCFGSTSNLYSHMRHHSGYKAFVCQECSKSFYTKQELKTHILTHTGEKPFSCQFCEKKFAQMAHLKRHEKLHLKN